MSTTITPFIVRFRQYLRHADLLRVNHRTAAQGLGVGYSSMRRKLAEAGTSFSSEYRNEQRERFLALWSENPGGYVPTYAEACGYWCDNSFLRAFPDLFGMRFSEYKRAHAKQEAA